MHWDRLHAWNLTAIPPTCLQEGLHPRSLLQSQKRTFSMTLLAMYSLSLFAGPCEVPSMNLAITSNSGPRQSDLPTSTFFLCHCWSRTPLGRGGYTKATNTMYKSTTIGISSLWRKSPTRLNEPLPIKQKCLSTSLENYLQINAFPASSGGARKEVSSSINENYQESKVECQEKSPL